MARTAARRTALARSLGVSASRRIVLGQPHPEELLESAEQLDELEAGQPEIAVE
jgi:hypothetical protein